MLEFQTFFTNQRLDELFYNVKWLLFFVAPAVMIFFAIMILPMMIDVIRVAFGGAKKDKKKDDDYDVYRY